MRFSSRLLSLSTDPTKSIVGFVKAAASFCSSNTAQLATITASVGSCYLLIFAQFDESVNALGVLEPEGLIRSIQVPQGGIIDNVFVKDGDSVRINQPLFSLTQDDLSAVVLSKQESINSLKKQLHLNRLQQESFLASQESQINAFLSSYNYGKSLASQLENLSKIGAISSFQYLSQLQKNVETEEKINYLRNELRQKKYEYDDAYSSLLSRLKTSEAELATIKIKDRYSVVRSPVDGRVFDLKTNSSLYIGQASEILLKIVPDGNLLAKVAVPGNKIAFVRKNQTADITIDSYPSSDFGTIGGIVTDISSTSYAPDTQNSKQSSDQAIYDVSISLKTQHLVSNKNKLILTPGMSLSANIVLRKTSLLSMLFDSLKTKASSLSAI